MNTIRRFCTGCNAVIFAFVGWVSLCAGCGGSGGAPRAQPPTAPPVETTVTPFVARDLDLPVKEGTMPLVYLVETAGGVRVVDLTTQHALAQTMATGESIVSIDPVHGVSIGGTVFAQGPLPADHRYAVYFESGGFHPEDELRTSTERNAPKIESGDLSNLIKSNQNSGFGPATAPASQPSPRVQPHH
jgi:hypothetical protein